MTSRHDLFVVDPNDFVALRDDLARELRGSGDKTGAADVKKLRRPAVAVWALNRVAADHAELVEDLVDAADRARAAQRAMLEGEAADDFRVALAARRAAIAAVAKAATQAIVTSGRSADTYARDVENTLNVVVASAELGSALRQSELSGVPTDPGDLTDLFSDVQLPPGGPTPTPKPRSKLVSTARPKPEQPLHSDAKRAEPAGPSPALLEARDAAARLVGELAAADRALETADSALVRTEAAADAARRHAEEAMADRDRARALRDVVAAQLADTRARVNALDSP